jgi:superfamily II DNA or RNA helicase
VIHLRDYQSDCIGEIRAAYRAGRRSPLLVSPTGSGKTVMFAYISQGTSRKGNRVLILVHRQELVDQTCRTLLAFGVDHGVIAAGRSPDRTHAVQVGSVQTVVRRLDYFRPDLIIIDEAHHGTAGSWRKVLDANPQARILGVTATPERLDGKGLKDVFDDLIRGPEVSWLIDNGHLSRPRYYAPPQAANLTGLHMRGGDYAKDELAKAMDDKAITGDAVEHYARICGGVPAVAFCVSVAHAQHVAEQFQAAGFRAAVLDGTLDRDSRRDRVKALGDGRLQVLTSCEIINEGFDLPIVTAAILLRPTMSLGLHLQQVGRVLRPAPGKDRAIILDHVGNLARHGFAEDVRDWSLEGRPKKKKRKADDEADVNVRQCPSCYCAHAPAASCPECGHVYQLTQREIEVRDGTLVELDVWAVRRQRKDEQRGAQTLNDLIALGRARNYKNPAVWARHIWNARQGKSRHHAPAIDAGGCP